MEWIKIGTLHERVYTAKANRGHYRIDLDMPADRWVLSLNNKRLVENIYYVVNAKRIAKFYDVTGESAFPDSLRSRPDGGAPRYTATD